MAPAAVRHHLAILLEDGRIVHERVQPKRGRGRPEKIYGISNRLLGENFASLSAALLETWLDSMPASKQEQALRALGNTLGSEAGRVEAGIPAAARLVKITERLNALNYQARWEAGAHGPHVLLGHCPYAAIIGTHPELCTVDGALLSSLAGAAVEQLAKMDSKPGSPTHCIFSLQLTGTAAQSRGARS
jgi:predicted ArsR family transcriptional regulator